MSKRILCFGDSNTWGYDGQTGLRFAEDVRWTGVLQKAFGPRIYVCLRRGQNGRTTVFADPVEGSKSGLAYLEPCLETANPLDLVILMLGTNDAKRSLRAKCLSDFRSAKRLAEVILRHDYAPYPRPELLLISPIEMDAAILAENDLIRNFSSYLRSELQNFQIFRGAGA